MGDGHVRRRGSSSNRRDISMLKEKGSSTVAQLVLMSFLNKGSEEAQGNLIRPVRKSASDL